MLKVELHNIIDEMQNILISVNKFKADDTDSRYIIIIQNLEQNINLLNELKCKGGMEKLKTPPRPNIHPTEYINNYDWLNGILLTKVQGIQEAVEDNFKTEKDLLFYNKLSKFEKDYYYNNKQIIIIEEFITLIEKYLIKPAIDAGRYNDNGGSCFVGAGIDVYHRLSMRYQRVVLKRVFKLGYGDNGQGLKLRDILDVLETYKIKVLGDQGRMD